MKFISGFRPFAAIVGSFLGLVTSHAQVTTEPATGLSTNSGVATLNASINPGGHGAGVFFEWGLTTAYGSTNTPSPAGSGNATVPISATISNLMSLTNYHFRAVATNSVATNVGGDLTFSTPHYPGALSNPVIVGGKLQVTVSGTANVLYGIYASTNFTAWQLLPPGQFTYLSSRPFQVNVASLTNVGQWFYLLR